MPKRQREEDGETKDKPVMLTLYERWCVPTFNAILELVLKPEVERKLVAMAPSINSSTTSKRKVEYRTGEFEQGSYTGLVSSPFLDGFAGYVPIFTTATSTS